MPTDIETLAASLEENKNLLSQLSGAMDLVSNVQENTADRISDLEEKVSALDGLPATMAEASKLMVTQAADLEKCIALIAGLSARIAVLESRPEGQAEAPAEPAPAPEAPPTPAPATEPVEPPSGQSLKLVDANGGESFFPIDGGSLVIGRHSSCDITLKVAGVSRRHAEITRNRAGNLEIKDLSSGGGFSINGKKRKKGRLKNDDVIAIGPFELVVVPG